MSYANDGNTDELRARRATVVAWVVVLLLVASMFFRALVSRWLYDDPPRTWQYRTSPQIPAQTYSSTEPVSDSLQVERQVPLPPQSQKGAAK